MRESEGMTRQGDYPWMSSQAAEKYEKEALEKGVSLVARSKHGFMREYELAGRAAAMRKRCLPSDVQGGSVWGEKRAGFIARHLEQYKQNPTPRRRLALIMWAYMPADPYI